MIKYSKSLDILMDAKVIRAVNSFAKITDWKDCTKEQSDLFYYGITMPEGKQRKAGTLELEDIPEPTDSELVHLAQSEMIAELNWCDMQIKLHASSDERAVSTIDDIYAHARACRDYVQSVDGELTIVGDKPVRPE